MELRPYQSAAVEAIYRHLRERDDNPVVVIPTAGGKTPILATICRDAVIRWSGRVLVVSHVKELLEQAVDKLRLVAPDLSVGVFSAGLNRRDIEHQVIVAGIQSIYRRACELDAFDLVIVDECFPAGTPISTPGGAMAIEAVRPLDVVETALGPSPVLAVRSRSVTQLVHIEISDGSIISCTPNHQFFTSRGWTEARTLAVGEILFSREDVRALRRRVSALEETPVRREGVGLPGEVLGQAEVLLNLLLEEAREPYEPYGRAAEGSPAVEGAQTQADPTGRQRRPPDAATTSAASRSGSRMGGRGRRAHGRAQGFGIPDQLQTGSRQPRAEVGNRTRWSQSRVHLACGTGRQEGRLSSVARVVSVSREQCARPRTVFNLHVDRHPSYFAHGKLVHNCHLIPTDGDGMYRQFLADAKVISPHVRVIGMTATPFRMDSGPICSPDHFLNTICYEIGVRQLIDEGYLCPLISKAGAIKVDTSALHMRGGEFIAEEVEKLMDRDGLVEAACREVVEYTRDRHSCLIFAAGVKHGRHVVRVLRDQHGIECGFVCGETSAPEREELIARFRRSQSGCLFEREPLKYLCNVNVLTTGFDAPNVDCVALLRPTASPVLYVQAVGRGFRLHPGKKNCLVLDFGGNILRHGPVDQLTIKEKNTKGPQPAPAKECPECHSVIAAGFTTCPDCGYEFPPPDRQAHEATASSAGILSDQTTDTEYDVLDVYYGVHYKRGADADAPRSMRVDYRVGLSHWISEWICVEHEGYARRKAEQWWTRRSPDPVPDTAERAVEIAEAGGLCATKRIKVRTKPGERFDRIVSYVLGPLPEPVPAEVTEYDETELPF